MNNTFKKALFILKDGGVLLFLVIAYQLLISITTFPMSQLLPNSPVFWISAMSNIFLTTAFVAGWLYLVRQLVEKSQNSNEDKLLGIHICKDFFPGVGKYFLSATLYCFLYLLMFAGMSFLIFKAGVILLGEPSISVETFKNASMSVEASKELVDSLSRTQLLNLSYWIILVAGSFFTFLYLTIFWVAEIFLNTKNIFIAFFKSLKFIYKNFLSSFGVYLILSIINLILMVLSVFASLNLFLSVIFILLSCYFTCYYMVVIFLFYYEKEKGNCDFRSDCNGQEQICSENSEEN